MRQNNFYLKKRQLKAYADKLQRLYMSADVEAKNQIEKLIRKIKYLVRELMHMVPNAELRKILGTSAILLGISFGNKSHAQIFGTPVLNPFGLVSTNTQAFPAFADLDADGDFDLLVGEFYGNVNYFQNVGSDLNPEFAAPDVNPFGLFPSFYFAFPAFADLDADGDLDLLVGEYYGSMKYFQNTGSSTNPEFVLPLVNPFDLESTFALAAPAFADLDGDGDMDLLVGEGYGALQYFQNTGSPDSPQFAAPLVNPFGLDTVNFVSLPAFTDLDLDGDLDLLVGEDYGVMQYFENKGSATDPDFAPPIPNPFGLVSTYANAFPTFADLDNDGDPDLLVGEYYGTMQYFQNYSVSLPKVSQNFDLTLFPNPVRNFLNLDTEESILKIEVFDILGKNLATFRNQVRQVFLGNLNPGTYIVKVTSKDGHFTAQKIQKQ